MTFGENVKRVRKVLGISGEELAIRCGLSSTAIHYIEKGEREPSLRTAILIAKGLGCKINILIDEV